MTQTKEDRIRLHFKSLKRTGVCCGWSYHGMGEIYMALAERWGMPIVEIKAIVHPNEPAQPRKQPWHNRVNRLVFWQRVNRGIGESTARKYDREEVL